MRSSTKIIFALIMLSATVGMSMPSQANAQVAQGLASCAVGSIVSSYITSSLTSLFSSFGGGSSSNEVPVGAKKLEADSNKVIAKNFSLDKLASCAAKQMLHQMTLDTVGWINTGFRGRPAFLTNPEGFFLDVADQVTGELISRDGPLQGLCSPWSVDIRLALSMGQLGNTASGLPGRQRYYCTLGRIIENYQGLTANGANINGFLEGDFSQGGWAAFIALTTESQNNPIGLSIMSRSDQLFAIGQRQTKAASQLQQGGGFMSWEQCEDLPQSQTDTEDFDPSSLATSNIDGSSSNIRMAPNGHWQKCDTKTPGSVIAASLNNQLASPTRQLEVANDINSVVSQLMSALINQALRQGLSSLSPSSNSASSRQYLRNAQAEINTPPTVQTFTPPPTPSTQPTTTPSTMPSQPTQQELCAIYATVPNMPLPPFCPATPPEEPTTTPIEP